jgi:hypothetical protein
MTTVQATDSPAAAGTRILLETTFATWRFSAIKGLLDIGAFEQLAEGPLTVGELATRCGADAEILRRVLRCVAAAGLLRSARPHQYELTDACRAIMGGFAFGGFQFNADPEMWRALGEITETLRSGKPPFLARHGSFYDYLATQPATAAGFHALVTGNYAPAAEALAQAVDFAQFGTVVDVGGGHGGFITAILRAHPGVRGILADQGAALPGARAHLAANGLADRCEVVACDFFMDPLPPGAGGYLLAHIIHGWNDEQAIAILRAVRAAIPSDGQLFLVEMMLPDDDSPHLGKDLDIRVLTTQPGRERTEAEYASLLTRAGFRPSPAMPLARVESVVRAAPMTTRSRETAGTWP